MVPFLSVSVVSLRRIDIDPRVEPQFGLRLGAAGPRIEFDHRVGTVGVVEHHIHDDRDTAFVALINEPFEIIRLAVRSVQREIEHRVVAPALVSLKLRNRHQFDRIHTQVLNIIQPVNNTLEGAFGGVIIHPDLIDDQVLARRTLKIECGT